MAETLRLRLAAGVGRRKAPGAEGGFVSEMRIIAAEVGGYALDLLLGDPEWLRPIHPVVLMGKKITALESFLRERFPKTERGERLAGLVLALTVAGSTWIISRGMLQLLRSISGAAALSLETVWCWEALAVRDLKVEAERVQAALERQDIETARKAVARIVGRDTGSLSGDGVTRAAVETVAENFADGVVAPLFYMAMGGAPLALCFKAVSTMDSMLGYQNERYRNFGRAAARLDDAANFLPARLGALLLMAAANLRGENSKDAYRIWHRDRRKHASPNAGQCEAAMAGALGLRLCGPASYFGQRVEKPWIGDERREIEPADIHRACRLEYTGSALALTLFSQLRAGLGAGGYRPLAGGISAWS